MSSRNWLDTRDAVLVPFAGNISTRLSATPVAYNCVAADATALATAYTNYSTSVTTVNNPATRTKVTLAQRAVNKATLIALLRLLYKNSTRATSPPTSAKNSVCRSETLPPRP
jgi:hypothetical protein